MDDYHRAERSRQTTLLSQLYQHPKSDACAKFYLSLDELHAAGASMEDIVAAIEHRLKSKIFNASGPVLVFLDEVHFLPQWSLAAKILYDNSRHLFLVCTGSSAISFWTNPDIGRRAKMISIPPLSFEEFRGIESLYGETAVSQLSGEEHIPPKTPLLETSRALELKKAIFETGSAEEVFNRLKELEAQDIKTANDGLVDDYVNFYGSIPYAAMIKHRHKCYEEELQLSIQSHDRPDLQFRRPNREAAEKEIKDRILQTLNTLFLRDLEVLGTFDTKTKNKFLGLLLLLANADSVNLRKIAHNLELNVLTVQNMLQALAAGEIIIPVGPLGTSLGKIAKPYKYLFNSPALRLALSPMYLNSSEEMDPGDVSRLRGRLLEDTVAMYLKRLFVNQPIAGVLEYDAAAGGADFVIMPRGLKSESIVLEVGYNKTNSDQVAKTLKRFKNKRGLVVTNRPLSLNKPAGVVFVPLSTFLAL